MPKIADLPDQDGVILLRNIGASVVTLAPASGTNDWVGLSRLNAGESAMMDGFGGGWNVLMRGRARTDDEVVVGKMTVGGTLYVAGGVVGDLSANGKLSGTNSPNLLINGSGELGNTGWNGSTFGQVQGGYGEGPIFINANSINTGTWVIDQSDNIACGANVQLVLSAEVSADGLNAGQIYLKCEAFKTDGTYIGNVLTTPPIASKRGYTFQKGVGTTPTATAFVRVSRVADNAPNVSAYGVAFRRIKLERGSAPSLYSQEASIAYLGGAPAFAGRPSFAGRVPWDSGNLTNPMDLDGTQTVTGLKSFAQRIVVTKDPVNGAYANAPVCVVAPTGMASVALASKNGASVVQLRCTSDTSTLEVVNGSSGAYQPITCYSVTQTSDARLKTDVHTIANALEKLRRLRGVYYVMNDVHGVGVIAQEVREVFPEVVEELGVSAEDGTPYLGVNYANMVGPLLQGMLEIDAELQDAMKRIEALELAK